MAATFAPITALNYAKEFVQKLPVDRATIKYRIMDDAAKMIWNAAPWRWSIGTLPLSALSNDVDEVTISGGGVPGDFFKLVWAGLISGTEVQGLRVVAALSDGATYKGVPKWITSTTVATNKFRLYPLPSGYTTPPSLAAVYKKNHTAISAGNENTAGALVLDDEYYPVYQAFVLYFAFLYAEDPRATEQLRTAFALLEEMKRVENPVIDFYGETIQG